MNWSIFLAAAATASAIARSGYKREAIWETVTGFIVMVVVAITLGSRLQFIPLY